MYYTKSAWYCNCAIPNIKALDEMLEKPNRNPIGQE
jgi:hypothetical protein